MGKVARKIGVFVSDDRLSEYVYRKVSRTAEIFPFSFSPVSFTKSVVLQPGDISGLLHYLRQEDIYELVFIGKISPQYVFSEVLHPSGRQFLETVGPLQGEGILLGLVTLLEKEKIKVLPLTEVLAEELALEKIYTLRQPEENELRDIKIGVSFLKDTMKYRVGQSAAVKDGMIIAVEGVEGTDGMLTRIGTYPNCRDFVVVKIAGKKKDERFDVPVVGPETIKSMKSAGGRVAAVEVGKTIIFDEGEIVSLCNKSDITLLGIRG